MNLWVMTQYACYFRSFSPHSSVVMPALLPLREKKVPQKYRSILHSFDLTGYLICKFNLFQRKNVNVFVK